jgi:cob(I)alamin adenosyltransferase
MVVVNLTRIYTRTGDAGTTRLGDLSETSKNDLRLGAYADVDEANAQLGTALA